MQATQEGLVPLKNWIKSALDRIIQECMNEPALEFVWVGDDAVDPLQQAQTLQILVGAGIKTREEARAELGLGPAAGALPDKAPAGLGKFNSDHDERADPRQRTTLSGGYRWPATSNCELVMTKRPTSMKFEKASKPGPENKTRTFS